MRLAIVLAVVVGVAVAASISLFLAGPEYTARALVYAVISGILGVLILGGIAFAAGQGGVARTISLVIASQLLVSLILDGIGLFGADPRGISYLTVLGAVLILVGGVLVVRY